MILAIIYIILSSLTASLGGVLLKLSSKRRIFNKYLFSGIFLYGISFIFLFLALFTLELSIAYNIAASLTYIFAFIFGHFIFKEKLTLLKIVGIILIITGIFILTFLTI